MQAIIEVQIESNEELNSLRSKTSRVGKCGILPNGLVNSVSY